MFESIAMLAVRLLMLVVLVVFVSGLACYALAAMGFDRLTNYLCSDLETFE